MRVAAIGPHLPDRRGRSGNVYCEADALSIWREPWPARDTRDRSQLVWLGSVGIRFVDLRALAEDEASAVGRPNSIVSHDAAEPSRSSGWKRQTPHGSF